MSEVAIKYVGPAVKRILTGANGVEYVWEVTNNYVVAVDVETAANLITYPNPGQFEVAPNQRVSRSVVRRLAELVGEEPERIAALFEKAVFVPAPKLQDIHGIGAAREAELNAAGVDSVARLAAQDEAGIAHLARNTGASRREIEAWVAAAKELVGE